MSSNSLRQTAHTHCASVHLAAKLVAALLRVAAVTAGMVESNGSLPLGLWLTSPAGWLPRTGIISGTQRSVIEYGLPFLHGAGSCRSMYAACTWVQHANHSAYEPPMYRLNDWYLQVPEMQIQVASCREPRYKAQHRLVTVAAVLQWW